VSLSPDESAVKLSPSSGCFKLLIISVVRASAISESGRVAGQPKASKLLILESKLGDDWGHKEVDGTQAVLGILAVVVGALVIAGSPEVVVVACWDAILEAAG
jgi:hypothetical protein